MVRRQMLVPALAVVAGFTLAACSDDMVTQPRLTPGGALLAKAGSGSSGTYLIVGTGNSLPSDLEQRVAVAGGTLVKAHEAIGVAVATGDAAFAAAAVRIPGVESVTSDLVYELAAPARVVEVADGFAADAAADVAQSASSTDDDVYSFWQWAPAAVNAPEAWAAGYRGAGVRVAVLDGGLFASHPDLAARVDVKYSKSFACFPAPVGCTAFNSDVGTFWHGTHVAGIVAASDNAGGAVGIAPSAELIGVKVLHNGTGSFSWMLDGIVYAATPREEGGAGAQVINMSLGLLFDMADPENAKADIKELDKIIGRVASYALSRGVTIIAAAGNDGMHLGKQFLNFPSMANKIISVGATGPVGWAFGQGDLWNAFSRQASYTNFGKKGVDLAAPGGDSFLYDDKLKPTEQPLCGVRKAPGVLTAPCYAFDMYLSTTRAGWGFSSGTSMASPVVAGVAALIIDKYNGLITPAGVKAKLQQGALDLGKPGNDDTYGHGWINAWGSVSR